MFLQMFDVIVYHPSYVGCDPSTDFRGMGFFGLLQLEYFARKHTENAKRCLQESINPLRAYFPFAATGINFTFFLMEGYSKAFFTGSYPFSGRFLGVPIFF